MNRVMGLDQLNPVKLEGATPFEKVASGLRRGESFTPDLIRALNETLAHVK